MALINALASKKNLTPKKVSPPWLKNAAKSLGMIGKETLKQMMPTTVSTTANVRRDVQATIQSIKANRTGGIKKAISDRPEFSNIRTFFKNSIEDLKSGNLYNDTRDAFNMGDETGFTFGDSSMDEDFQFDNEEAKSITNNYNFTNVENNQKATLDAIREQTQYQLSASEATVNAMVTISATSVGKMTEIGSMVVQELSKVNQNLASIIEYNNTNMNKFIEASLTYYSATTRAMEESYSSDKMTSDDLFDSSGGFSLSNYGKLVKQNASRYWNNSGGGMISLILSSLNMASANPLGFVLPMALSGIAPKALKGSMAQFDNAIKNLIPTILSRVGDLGKVKTGTFMDKLGEALGKILGVKEGKKNDLSVNIDKGPMQYNGKANFAITELIPKYLKESNTYLKNISEFITGKKVDKKDHEVFDWESGTHKTIAQMEQEIMTRVMSSITTQFSSSSFGKNLDKAGRHLFSDNKKDIEDFNKAKEELFLLMERHDGHLEFNDPKFIKAMTDKLHADEKIKNAMSGIIESMVLRGDSSIPSINGAKMRATSSRNKALEEIEKNPDLALHHFIINNAEYFNGFVDDFFGGDLQKAAIALSSGKGHNLETLLKGITIGGRAKGSLNKLASKGKGLVGEIKTKVNDFKDRGKDSKYYRDKLKDVKFYDEAEKYDVDPDSMLAPVVGMLDGLTATLNKFMIGDVSGIIESTYSSIGTAIVGTVTKVSEPLKTFFVGKSNTKETSYLEGEGIFTSLANGMKESFLTIRRGITGQGFKTSSGEVIEALEEKGDNKSLLGHIKHMTSEVKKGISAKLFGTDPSDESEEERKEGVIGKSKKLMYSAFGTLSAGILGWKEALFGESKDVPENETDEERKTRVKKETQELVANLGKNLRNTVPVAIGGALKGATFGSLSGGLLGNLIGGPIGGAVLGSVAAIVSRNETFMNYMFGREELDENGEKTGKRMGGFISKGTQEYLKKNKYNIIGGAAIGAAATVFTGGGVIGNLLGTLVGGPLAGALMGIGTTLLAKSDMFKKFLFGDQERGQMGLVNILKSGFSKLSPKGAGNGSFKKLAGMAGIGVGVGALSFTALGKVGLLGWALTPGGVIGGALLGLGATILAQRKNFSKWLFGGEEDEINGLKYTKTGFLGKMGNMLMVNMVLPIKNSVSNFMEDFTTFTKYKVFDRINHIVEPAVLMVSGLFKGIQTQLMGGLNQIGKTLKETFLDNFVEKAGSILEPAVNAGTALANSIYSLSKFIISAPITVLHSLTSPIMQIAGQITAGVSYVIGASINNLVLRPLNALVIRPLAKTTQFIGSVALGTVEKVSNMITVVTDFGTGILNRIRSFSAKAEVAVLSTMKFFGDLSKDYIFTPLKNSFNKMIDDAKEELKFGLDKVYGYLRGKFDPVFKSAIGGITGFFKNVANVTKDKLSLIYQDATEKIKESVDNTKEGFKGMVLDLSKKVMGEMASSAAFAFIPKFLSGAKDFVKDHYKDYKSSYWNPAFNDLEKRGLMGQLASRRMSVATYFDQIQKNREAAKARRQEQENIKKIAKATGYQKFEDTEANRQLAILMSGKNIKFKGTAKEDPDDKRAKQFAEYQDNMKKSVYESKDSIQKTSLGILQGVNKIASFMTDFLARFVDPMHRNVGYRQYFRRPKKGLLNAALNKLGLSEDETILVEEDDLEDVVENPEEIVGYAKGTRSARKGMAIVGEKGPELIIGKKKDRRGRRLARKAGVSYPEFIRMQGGEEVVPNEKLASMEATLVGATDEHDEDEQKTGRSQRAEIAAMKEDESDDRTQEEIARNTRNLANTAEKQSVNWEAIFGKAGLITGGILTLLPFLPSIVDGVKDTVLGFGQSILDGIVSFGKNLGTNIMTGIGSIGESLALAWNSLNSGSTIQERVKEQADTVGDVIKNIVSLDPAGALGSWIYGADGKWDHGSSNRAKHLFTYKPVRKATTSLIHHYGTKSSVKLMDKSKSLIDSAEKWALTEGNPSLLKFTDDATKKSVEEMFDFVGKSSTKIDDLAEISQRILLKGTDEKLAKGASRELVEETFEATIKNPNTILSKVKNFLSKGLDDIIEFAIKKIRPNHVKGAFKSSIKTMISAGKNHILKIASKVFPHAAPKILSILGVTAGVASTGVGAVAVAIREVGGSVIFGLNGLTGVKKLFKTEKTDFIMMAISAALGAISGTTAGSIFEIIADVAKSITGFDVTHYIAMFLYSVICAVLGDDGERRMKELSESQEEFRNKYIDHMDFELKNRYELYKKTGMINPDMSFSQFDAGVKSGEIKLELESFDDFNERINRDAFGSLVNGMGSVMGATVNTISEIGTKVKEFMTGSKEIIHSYVDKIGNEWKLDKKGNYVVTTTEGEEVTIKAEDMTEEKKKEVDTGIENNKNMIDEKSYKPSEQGNKVLMYKGTGSYLIENPNNPYEYFLFNKKNKFISTLTKGEVNNHILDGRLEFSNLDLKDFEKATVKVGEKTGSYAHDSRIAQYEAGVNMPYIKDYAKLNKMMDGNHRFYSDHDLSKDTTLEYMINKQTGNVDAYNTTTGEKVKSMTPADAIKLFEDGSVSVYDKTYANAYFNNKDNFYYSDKTKSYYLYNMVTGKYDVYKEGDSKPSSFIEKVAFDYMVEQNLITKKPMDPRQFEKIILEITEVDSLKYFKFSTYHLQLQEKERERERTKQEAEINGRNRASSEKYDPNKIIKSYHNKDQWDTSGIFLGGGNYTYGVDIARQKAEEEAERKRIEANFDKIPKPEFRHLSPTELEKVDLQLKSVGSSAYNLVPKGTATPTTGGQGGGRGTYNGSSYFSQNDSRWANMPYYTSTGFNDGSTMGNSGCGPTAMSMVINETNRRTDTNPVELARYAQQAGYRDNTGTNWGFVNSAANAYGIGSTMTQNPSAEYISRSLDRGMPIMLSGTDGGSNYTSAGHYIVAMGKDSNGNAIVHDPRGKSYSGSKSINSIAKGAEAVWNFFKGGHGKNAIFNYGGFGAVAMDETGNAVKVADGGNSSGKRVNIIQAITTNNACYKAGEKLKGIAGLMLHSIGVGQPNAQSLVNNYNKFHPNGREVAVHAFIDANNGTVYQTLPWDMRGWHAGGTANNLYIGVEMCEPAGVYSASNTVKREGYTDVQLSAIKKTYDSAVILFAALCRRFNLDPTAKGVIISHTEGNRLGIASAHADPEHLWGPSGSGYTMDKFRRDVKAALSTISDNFVNSLYLMGSGLPTMAMDYSNAPDIENIGPNSDLYGNLSSSNKLGLGNVLDTVSSVFGKVQNTLWNALLTDNYDINWADVFADQQANTNGTGTTNASLPVNDAKYLTDYSQYNGKDVPLPDNGQSTAMYMRDVLSKNKNAKKVWDFLISKGFSKRGAAAMMGNLYSESTIKPLMAEKGRVESKVGIYDNFEAAIKTYTDMVDSGKYPAESFYNDGVGYGLAGWTWKTRKQELLEIAKARGKSIGDIDVQLELLYRELERTYPDMLSELKSTDNLMTGSNRVLHEFEKPKDSSQKVEFKRAGYGQVIYDLYGRGGAGEGAFINEKSSKYKKLFPEPTNRNRGGRGGSNNISARYNTVSSRTPNGKSYSSYFKQIDAMGGFGNSVSFDKVVELLKLIAFNTDKLGLLSDINKNIVNSAGKAIMVNNTTAVPIPDNSQKDVEYKTSSNEEIARKIAYGF